MKEAFLGTRSLMTSDRSVEGVPSNCSHCKTNTRSILTMHILCQGCSAFKRPRAECPAGCTSRRYAAPSTWVTHCTDALYHCPMHQGLHFTSPLPWGSKNWRREGKPREPGCYCSPGGDGVWWLGTSLGSQLNPSWATHGPQADSRTLCQALDTDNQFIISAIRDLNLSSPPFAHTFLLSPRHFS